MTLASSVSEASSLLMILESSFMIVIGLKYRLQATGLMALPDLVTIVSENEAKV
jgi:hypothetical protein